MTATPMRCLLVDDEPLARDRLRALLEESGLDALREARSEKSLKRITVHVGCRLRVVPLEDIRWIEADEGFVFAHTPEGRYRTDFTLGELEKRLPEDHSCAPTARRSSTSMRSTSFCPNSPVRVPSGSRRRSPMRYCG